MVWTLLVSVSCFITCRNTSAGVRRAAWFTKLWCTGILRTIGVRMIVHGGSRDFSGRLVIANHSSYLDILINGALTKLRFAAKKEVRKYPILGAMIAPGLPIWVDRENRADSSRALEEFRRSLDIGANLLVYPEGTTTDGLGALRPFKSTVFQAVCGTAYPIQPVIIRTHVAADGFNPAWYGNMSLLPHLFRLFSHRGWCCDIYILPPQFARPDETRKELAARMYRNMSAALEVIGSGDKQAAAGLFGR